MNLDEIRARCEAATPGPWKVVGKGNSVPSLAVIVDALDEKAQVNVCSNISIKNGNAAFISHACEDIPALLDEVERLTARAEAAEARAEAAIRGGEHADN